MLLGRRARHRRLLRQAGCRIPQALGLDFLLPIYFLGLVMSFRKRPLWLPVVAASGVASVIAYKIVGSPWHISIGATCRHRCRGGHAA